MSAVDSHASGGVPRIRLRLIVDEATGGIWSFETSFTIGRDRTCGLSLDSALASRIHAAVSFEDGSWWVSDLGSTNGTFIGGNRVERAPLLDGTVLQIGRGGPTLAVALEDEPPIRDPDTPPPTLAAPRLSRPGSAGRPSAAPAGPAPSASAPLFGQGASPAGEGKPEAPLRSETPPAPPPRSGSPLTDPALASVMERYFAAEDDGEAGEHTRMIRAAYGHARKRDRRPLILAAGGLVFALAGALLFVGLQRRQLQILRTQAADIFTLMRSQDVQAANFRRLIEDRGDAALEAQLVELETERARLRDRYDGFVEQLGVYRKLRDPEERLIYRTARTFGESEFAVDGAFVVAVRATIRDYWQGPGRARLIEAVERGEQGGFVREIVRTLESRGLPAEFFYLALQESDLIADRVGPETRFGRAKGMWQFIPVTARRYGLDPGPRPNGPGVDRGLDQRLDFRLATDAASRYLSDLYGTLAQASGLLVMASYNWGEHRVSPRLERLESPREVFEATFEDVPLNPDARTYWRFLGEYADRMPTETKDYVLKIFAAAVIGQDPKLFGFDFNDPLAPYRVAP